MNKRNADAKNSSSASDTAKKVQEYKDSLKTKAEQLIVKGFPEKIVKLNELLATPNFADRALADVHQDLNIPVPDPVPIDQNNTEEPAAKRPRVDDNFIVAPGYAGTRVMSLTKGPVPCNKPLTELIALVKPHIRALVEDSNLLKMWISFMIPKIEDGNNFGVSIQEDTLAEVQSVESEAAAFFDQISRYFISRGKIVSKVAKYPHISDYRRAVQSFFQAGGARVYLTLEELAIFIRILKSRTSGQDEFDEKEYLSLWLVMCEVRNRYCSLHDIVIKNLEKIKKPRSSNAESLY